MRLIDLFARRVEPVNGGPSFEYGARKPWSALLGADPEVADTTFRSMVADVHEKSGPVSAAVTARALLLSQVHFAWHDPTDPGSELQFGQGLEALDRVGIMTRAETLFRLEQDASYSGGAILARRRGTRNIYRLDPSRVTYAFGSNSDPTFSASEEMELPFDARVTAIVYNSSDIAHHATPSVGDLEVFYPDEFVHWRPEPDPIRWWRGQSWVTSLLNDVALDGQISKHQSKFFQNAATPNLVFMMGEDKTPDEVAAYAEVLNSKHAGSGNAWRNMFLGGAVDVKTVGVDFSKLSLKDIQGGLETRIAMRARVSPVILGAREGLSGSSLNTGNYAAARRLLSDGWFSPTVKSLCEAMERLIPPPPGLRMTHDPSRVLFLQEDRKDEADIAASKVSAIRTLVDGGFDPMTAVATIAPEWRNRLDHAGLLSVQLQEPGASNTAGKRAVMGRLGRYDDPEMIDPDQIVAGVNADVAATALAVLDAVEPDVVTMHELRAAMSAALNGGDR